MTAQDRIRRSIEDYVDLWAPGTLTPHQAADLAGRIRDDLDSDRELLVLEDLPEDEDEVVIVHTNGLALEGYPVSDLAASGIPMLPVWTTLEPSSSDGLVVIDCLPLARAQRRWWRLRIRARRSGPGQRLEATWWRNRRRLRDARAGARRLLEELSAW